MDCRQFGDVLSRRTEHLDDAIIYSMHPTDGWIGHVATGTFPAQAGTEHTYDRFENVFPKLTGEWSDITTAACVGTPCDPSETKIGLGFTRDSYKLQGRSYSSDIFCWDLILSADRAKAQFAHYVTTLRRAATYIMGERFRTQGLNIAKKKWVLNNNTLTPLVATWNADFSILNVSSLPTSQLTARHLQRRVIPQRNLGALSVGASPTQSEQRRGAIQPWLELVTDPESLWGLVEGNGELSDKWRFAEFEDAQKFYQYGWDGHIGNYAVRTDPVSLRFKVCHQNGDGSYDLAVVFPYTNVAATGGIKEEVNEAYDLADIELSFIWHRMAMISLVRDSTSINPEMPFAARNFAGKWFFAMNNLTCGLDTNGNPIAVDNSRMNKGMFKGDFENAIKSEYPEFAEAFLHLREQACILDKPNCKALESCYPIEDQNSGNEPCPEEVIIT